MRDLPSSDDMDHQDAQEVDMANAGKRGHPTTDEVDEAKQSKKKNNGAEVKGSPIGNARNKMSTSHKVSNPDPSTAGKSEVNKPSPNAVDTRRMVKPGASEGEKKPKYDAFSKAPFIVLFRLSSDKENHKKRTSLFTMSKRLDKMNVKFSHIDKYSRDTWKATFSSKTLANSAITNPMVRDAGISAFIPKYKLSRKVVLREVPNDTSLDEIKKTMEDENQSVVIDNLFRLKRRNRETKQLEESETVCLEIKGEVFPEKVSMWRAIAPLKPYIQTVRLCYKCGRLGHTSKFCERPEACMTCAGEHRSSREEPCSREKKCVNCEGAHSTLDRGCPVYRKHAEIAKVMAFDNLPFMEARILVEKECGNRGAPPRKTLSNYPTLRNRSGIAQQTANLVPAGANWAEAVMGKGAGETAVDGDLRTLLQNIFTAVVNDPEGGKLCSRIMKAIELHTSTRNPMDSKNGSKQQK